MLRASAGPETLPPPEATAEEIRSAADEILARREFQQPPRSLYQRALDELGERFGDLLELLVRGGRGAYMAWFVLALVLAGVSWLFLRGVQRDRTRRIRGAQDDVDVDVRRPAADWAAEAARHEAAGEWRQAVRCRYRWLIASLARAGVVEEVPGTTSGEYRSLVTSARPSTAEPIASATDLFERAWYGNEATTAEEASAFGEAAGRVLDGSST